MSGSQKIKKEAFSWKWIVGFLFLMWGMTLLCRYLSVNGMPVVDTCKAERNFVAQSTARYEYCVPKDAVHTDEMGNTYLYCLKERGGILGIVVVAEQRYVEVIAEDDQLAALAEGSVTVMDEIITHSSRELSDGKQVKAR